MDIYLLQCIISLAVIAAHISAFCYFGEMTTSKFEELPESIYQSKWYEYPLEIQKYITLVLAHTQQPFHFSGYFVSSCTLHTYKEVAIIGYWFSLLPWFNFYLTLQIICISFEFFMLLCESKH